MKNNLKWVLGAALMASALPAMAEYAVYPLSASLTLNHDSPTSKGEKVEVVKLNSTSLVRAALGIDVGDSNSDVIASEVADECGEPGDDDYKACAAEVKSEVSNELRGLSHVVLALAVVDNDPCTSEVIAWNKEDEEVEETIATVSCGATFGADPADEKASSDIEVGLDSLNFEEGNVISGGSVQGFAKLTLKDNADNEDTALVSAVASSFTGQIFFDEGQDDALVSDGSLKVNFSKSIGEGDECEDLTVGDC